MTQEFHNILIVILFFGALGMYNGYLLLDDRTPEEAKDNKRIEFLWHLFGAIIFLLLSYIFYSVFGKKYVPFSLANAWLLFAGIVHVVGLKMPFFYVGTTAVTDRIQQWLAAKLSVPVTMLSAVLKVACYILSILYLKGII